MSKDLLSGLKPDAKLSRNGFDWSGRDVMSWQLGALYPIWNKSLIPNEDVRINVNHLLRTFPMSAPNFNRCRAHFEFYFVPYNQIWKNYDQFYTQRDDRQSVRTMNASTIVPCFDVVLLKRLAATDILNKFTGTLNFADDIHRFRGAPNALRLMDLLGYGSVVGYQNGFSDLLPETLNDNIRTAFLNSFGSTNTTYLNVFKAAAYQKIWASYYRDSVHDTNDYRDVFNYDDCNLSGVNDVNLNDDAHDVTKLFTQRYRCYKKDIYTGSYPSQQFGDISSVSFRAISIQNDDEDVAQSPAGFDDNGYLAANNGEGMPEWNISNAFDVYQFYRAEAVQLWRERVMRAGNRYRDNYKAHFGVVPKFLEDDYPEFVGSFSKLITVDDVTSTAETSEGALGALAGKGIAADQTENISYHCRDFGVLMCMFSIVPEMDYNATGIDKDNCALRFEDFIVPEFDRLGFQPIEQKERITNQPHIGFYINPNGAAGTNNFNENRVLGHNVRFYNHKGRVNKVHGRFQYLCLGYSPQYFVNGQKLLYQGDLSPFVMPTEDYIISGEFAPLSRYYISPRMCDPMFDVRSDGTELTDRFFGAVQINCDDVAPLSRSGLHAI